MVTAAFEHQLIHLIPILIWLTMGIILFIFCLRIRFASKKLGIYSKIIGPLTFSGYMGVIGGSAFLAEWIFRQVGIVCWHGLVANLGGYSIFTTMVVGVVITVRRYWCILQVIST